MDQFVLVGGLVAMLVVTVGLIYATVKQCFKDSD